ncbi:MAG: CYTH domain-containing protein [Flavobacteriia bacterium]|jgi:adenylate cyclase|nr:CYTH domain-containing protein [Flavobacteriia bacterium]
MSVEIERKFLVTTTQYKSLATTQVKITQGYLSKTPERTVRVRVAGDRAWLTIKGIGDAQGMVRKEWEYEIPKEDAIEMLAICEKPLIEKTRYTIPYQSLTIEVDEFQKPLQTVWAEVELPAVDTPFDPPPWLGEEVTGNPNYYNARL